MHKKTKDGIEWLQFDLLSDFPNLVHGVFLRKGGVSTAPFNTLNMGNFREDTVENILENRKRISACLNIPSLFSGTQVHKDQISILRGTDPFEKICDGIATQDKGIGLLTSHADCQAAIFYDPINNAIANIHSGWRGSVQNIFGKAVHKMQSEFGSRPENLLVGISPSLGPENAQFIHYKTELPESFWDYQVKPCYFDFWEISRMQLKACGLLDHHIEIASICTYANDTDFFSYRRDKQVTGRNGTVIALV